MIGSPFETGRHMRDARGGGDGAERYRAALRLVDATPGSIDAQRESWDGHAYPDFAPLFGDPQFKALVKPRG